VTADGAVDGKADGVTVGIVGFAVGFGVGIGVGASLGDEAKDGGTAVPVVYVYCVVRIAESGGLATADVRLVSGGGLMGGLGMGGRLNLISAVGCTVTG